jgi:predicted nucleotidyltransferase
MEAWINNLVKELRSRINAKYQVRDLRVFGSSARGERKGSSDVDVFVCLPALNRKIEEDLFDMAYELELEYNCLIDLIAVGESDLKEGPGVAPIYRQILAEGIAV